MILCKNIPEQNNIYLAKGKIMNLEKNEKLNKNQLNGIWGNGRTNGAEEVCATNVVATEDQPHCRHQVPCGLPGFSVPVLREQDAGSFKKDKAIPRRVRLMNNRCIRATVSGKSDNLPTGIVKRASSKDRDLCGMFLPRRHRHRGL